MAHSVALFVATLAIVAGCTLATPTKPFVSHAYNLPKQYLFRKSDRSLVVSSTYIDDAKYCGVAQYNASNADLGWDYLRVAPPQVMFTTEAGSLEAYYNAGYLEGYLTHKTLDYYLPPAPLVDGAGAFLRNHTAFMAAMVEKHAKTDKFWRQVGCQLEQMIGIADGYNAASGKNVTAFDVFVRNFRFEFNGMYSHLNVTNGQGLAPANGKGSHCSALIKVTHDDLFMAHDMWEDFLPNLPHRAFKVYEFQTTVALSSYPGMISSGDDWYRTSNLLSVQETSNVIWGSARDLYKKVTPHSVSEFLRVMAANYLADSGDEWTYYFSQFNSGTYNNQYMCVDHKKFTPGHPIVDGTLWIAEQIPGYVERGDVSHVLRDKGYWASYNIPYFRYIYVTMGYEVEEKKSGGWSYHGYRRAEIFHRNESAITGIEDMQRMMRYNNYRHDPLSLIPNCSGTPNGKCDPPYSSMLSIASRGDLMTMYNTSKEMKLHYGPQADFLVGPCFGAIDSKIASYKTRYSLESTIISGPTNDQQPSFSWGGFECPRPPGAVETYNHPWVQFHVKRP